MEEELEPENTKMYTNGIESNIDVVVEKICSSPPKPINSIKFGLAHDGPEGERERAILDDELLVTLTIKIMRRLFGNAISPDLMSQSDFDLLNAYINSIGYDLYLSYDEDEHKKYYKIKFTQLKTNKIL